MNTTPWYIYLVIQCLLGIKSYVTSKDFSKTMKGVVLNQIIIYLGLYLYAFKVLLKHDSKSPLLLTSHLAFLWFWIAFGTLTSVHTHSGFHLPLTVSPQFHEYHHSHPNQNFGVSGILDQFFGTDLVFRKSKQFQRNRVLYSLKTPDELIQ
ncbi:unnamed protein product [Medioppia subpectinata]|uniref:Fatty acid hydroxylase domain-containing protein n=1 Tax=Medioppia subpectinata TaxID=1979941 RepID=A0A7R9QCN4_9ACAR|nr:unnamed protein product [Medioppia subpectinata]CAG2118485.1 unnamed protein product [Medioppia subpectinata]